MFCIRSFAVMEGIAVECRYCGSCDTVTIPGPHPGGHYAKTSCVVYNRFIRWESKPPELKAPDPRSEVSRKLVQKYSPGYCQLCLRPTDAIPAPGTMEGHHVVQVDNGGTDERSNVWIVCTSCHRLIHHQRTYYGHYNQG